MTRVFPSFADVDLSDLKLPMIVIYEKPSDFPNHFVARIWEATIPAPTDVAMVESTLDAIHAGIPGRFIRMDRTPGDDPNILETWI